MCMHMYYKLSILWSMVATKNLMKMHALYKININKVNHRNTKGGTLW